MEESLCHQQLNVIKIIIYVYIYRVGVEHAYEEVSNCHRSTMTTYTYVITRCTVYCSRLALQ